MPDIEVICPGCGLKLISPDPGLHSHYNASLACVQLFWELTAFTLSLQDDDFIHQITVDTYAAQHTGPNMKPITLAFALIGLYLAFEKGHSGKEVQQAHMELAQKHQEWPKFPPPAGKSEITVQNVLQNVTRVSYKQPIYEWGRSVWALWTPEHHNVAALIKDSSHHF